MASKEMWDYLSNVTPDYVATELSIDSQGQLTEQGMFRARINTGYDGSEERIYLGPKQFRVSLSWGALSPSDAGTIYDFYFDTAKGRGTTRTFIWGHPTDGHKYTARFDCECPRSIRPPEIHGVTNITLRVLGRYAP